jgi:uncharacterized protein YjdB
MHITRLAPGNWRSRSLAVAMGATLLLAGACDNNTEPTPGEGPVVDVLISTIPLNESLADLIPGTTRQLLAGPVNADGVFVPGQTVSWSSSNAGVVSIDASSGLATAVAGGSATISATAGGATGTTTMEVRFPVGTVNVTPTGQTIRREGALQLSAETIDQSGATVTGRAISWSSLNPDIATVSATGLVSGVTDGDAIITATSEGAVGEATVTVFGSPVVATVTVSPAAPFMAVGTQQQLTAAAKAGSGTVITDAVVTWTTSDATVATVNATGLVDVLAAGTATITATADGISGTAALRGAPGLASGVAVTPPTIAPDGFAIYAFVVPAGKTSLKFNTTGGTGDADIYCFAPGVIPSAVNTNQNAAAFSNASDASAAGGNTEECEFANPAAGVWRVHVFAWGGDVAVTGLSLTATSAP